MLWIGGPPGSGKTTIATRISRRHGLRWYNADTQTWAHRDRAIRARHPAALRWEAMTPDERWVATAPAEMVELSLTLERWPMIAEDLRRLPASPLILAEGSTVLPELVASGIADPSRAVWLVQPSGLQRARLEARTGAPAGLSDPERARENTIQLWLLVGAEIERRARASGVTIVPVDGSRTVDESVGAVETLFADALAQGPLAATAAERRTLLRSANEAIATQVRAYYARPWAEGDADSVVRVFVCECGDPGCDTADVELAVGAFSARPVLAPGHG